MSADFDTMTAVELRERIARREVSPVEVARRALEKAESTQATLNCFSVIVFEAALAAARARRTGGHERRAARDHCTACHFR